MKHADIVIELFCWAICPECGHQFLLNKDNSPITGRSELPPSILSLLSEPELSEKPPQSPESHQVQDQKDNRKKDNLVSDEQ